VKYEVEDVVTKKKWVHISYKTFWKTIWGRGDLEEKPERERQHTGERVRGKKGKSILKKVLDKRVSDPAARSRVNGETSLSQRDKVTPRVEGLRARSKGEIGRDEGAWCCVSTGQKSLETG